jgi:sterol desaturase/sphingolipid hydroxylase (fatty acid hydroxylase superfamily)
MPNLINYAIPVFLLVLIAEALFDAWHDRKLFMRKDTLASLGMGLGSVIVGAAVKTFILVYVLDFLYRISPFRVGHEWWAWVTCWLFVDFMAYWAHRFGHECRLGWAAHVPHHSSEQYNLSTALRQSWTHFFFAVFFFPIALFGFDPKMVFLVNAANTIYQFWIHTQLIGKLGPLEWFLNTPSHHRVHHGSNEQYLDKNYGASLIIWDRIFGTFEPEQEKVVYGLTKNIKSYNLMTISFHEWRDMIADMRKAPTWSVWFKHLFYPPGWQPETPSGPSGHQESKQTVGSPLATALDK